MKKMSIYALMLLLLCSLAACGAAENSAAKEESSTAPVSIEASSVSEEALSAASVVETEAASKTEVPEEEFQQIVILDNDVCSFILTDVDPDGEWGYTWSVYVENKTDKNLMFSVDNVSVNGLYSDPFWGTTVSAGMKSNEEIVWYDDFAAQGLDDITLVKLDLTVYNDDDWMEEPLVEENFTVYPMGEDAVGEMYEREPAETDIVLVDNENCAVILTGIDPQGEWGYTWNVYLENRTDKNLMFSMNYVSINDLLCDPFWGTSVSAGAKFNTEIIWYSDELDAAGITDVTVVEFDLTVSDGDDWTVEPLFADTLTVYPDGEEAQMSYQREPAETDTVLVDNDLCTVIVTGFDPEADWGYTMKLYLVNKTDTPLGFSINDSAVNGYMCDPFWGLSVPAGKAAFSDVSWSTEDFDLNGITEVEELTLPLYVYDENSYEGLLDETFTVNP